MGLGLKRIELVSIFDFDDLDAASGDPLGSNPADQIHEFPELGVHGVLDLGGVLLELLELGVDAPDLVVLLRLGNHELEVQNVLILSGLSFGQFGVAGPHQSQASGPLQVGAVDVVQGNGAHSGESEAGEEDHGNQERHVGFHFL